MMRIEVTKNSKMVVEKNLLTTDDEEDTISLTMIVLHELLLLIDEMKCLMKELIETFNKNRSSQYCERKWEVIWSVFDLTEMYFR